MNVLLTYRKALLTGSVAALLFALQAISPLWAETNSNRPAEADKLHVVLLVAGHDGGIGNADMQDIAAMKKVIKTAFAKDMNRVVYHDLTVINKKTNKVYSSAEILSYLRGMKIGKNDNVLVFHSGHGGIADKNRPEESHILTVDGGQLARQEIRSILSAKQPRALMILTDCCSSYMNTSRGLSVEIDPKTPVLNVATVRNLLLKAVGIVNITAAEDGTVAIAEYHGANPAHAGSAFTVALTRLFYRQDVTFTSWEQIFPRLRTETLQASNGAHAARAFQISTQTVTTVTQPVTQQPVQQRFRS